LNFGFDNDGHLWNLPRTGAFVFQNTSCFHSDIWERLVYKIYYKLFEYQEKTFSVLLKAKKKSSQTPEHLSKRSLHMELIFTQVYSYKGGEPREDPG
jgi:hypothetical protein